MPAAALQRVPAPGTIAVDIEVLLPRRKCSLDLDDEDVETQLGGAQRARQAAAGAGDDEVGSVGAHPAHPLR